MAAPIRLTPDVPGAPEVEVVPDILRGPRVLLEGRRLPATHGPGGLSFEVPMADGTTRPLRLRGGFLGLRAMFDGVEYPVEPPLRLWEMFLVVLPLSILVLGVDAPTIAGTVAAALIAGIAVGVALVAMRSGRPGWLRALWALGATIVGYVLAGLLAASV